MTTVSIDKGWLTGEAGSFVQLNSITGLRVGHPSAAVFDADVLVEGQWITIATFADERAASERVTAVLKELKHLFRYGN